jgi:hypothetical protein
VPLLRDATHTYLGDNALLLHLLLDTPGRLVALSRTTPHIPTDDAMSIWEAWPPHLAHEEVPTPYGSTTRDFFASVLTSSPFNVGEQAEAKNLIRLYVGDTIRESTLQAHTMGATQETQMQQSSFKRVRKEAGDTENTGASLRHPQMGTPATEDPPPPNMTRR